MKRIYTRSGDGGMTRVAGGGRVPKDDIRIEANGCLDELNAVVGVVRSLLPDSHDWQSLLREVQLQLMAVMSQVATPSSLRHGNPNRLEEGWVEACEVEMDRLTAEMGESAHFLLPGGTPVAAHLHLARTVARRAERRLWTLHRQDPVPELVLRYLNRLSDLFFVLARHALWQADRQEERWQSFSYRRNL